MNSVRTEITHLSESIIDKSAEVFLRQLGFDGCIGLPRDKDIPEEGDDLHDQHLVLQRHPVEVGDLHPRPQLKK